MPIDPYLESRVLAADAVELIHILYEHALTQVKLARIALADHNIPARTQAISKVLAALGELEGSLDYSTGGSISHNLARLYQYMRKRLIEANLKRDAAALAEVESLMRTLDEGWTAMQYATSVPPALLYSHAVADAAAHSWSA
jgi:flagellar secretion chaperone FliS